MTIFEQIRLIVRDYLLNCEWKFIKKYFPDKLEFALNELQYEFDKCECCQKEKIWKINEPGDKICGACATIAMKTKCFNCYRTIFSNTKNKLTHLEIEFCRYCIENVDENLKQELNHEIECKYIRKENKFKINCKTT